MNAANICGVMFHNLCSVEKENQNCEGFRLILVSFCKNEHVTSRLLVGGQTAQMTQYMISVLYLTLVPT